MTAFSASAQYIPKFDLQGHRGARGLKPENTIPAFITALDYGVTTIELDVVITKDNHVVVSHEPWMSNEICLKSDSTPITKTESKTFNIYKMNYNEVLNFDCGSKGNEKFPEQEKVGARKPLLSDVIAAVEDHIKNKSAYEVDYNIEIKSTKETDNKFHPTPEVFSDLVYQTINQYLPMERVVIQSFDFRVLKYWHKKYPHVRLAALVEKVTGKDTPKAKMESLNKLGFTPSIYSPEMALTTEEVVKSIKKRKMRIIPWDVNKTEDMQRLKNWGVDGIITDYPNRAADLGLGLKRNVAGSPNGANKK